MADSLTQIKDDIFQVALPLPFALNIINAYLIRGESGWTIIDAGLNTSRARHCWQAAFEALKITQNDVEQIILTHAHPDHFGLAGWLQERFSASNGRIPPVKLSATENEISNIVWRDLDGWAENTLPFWLQCGLEIDVATAVSNSAIETGQRTLPHPTKIEIIAAGTEISIGNRLCKIFEMPGHSDGQLVFYDAKNQLLFSGDHVLNKITPNISRWPYSNINPLGDYLESFDTLRKLAVQITLPGHKTIITNLHERLTQIETHHETRLEETLTAVPTAKTVQEVSDTLFNQDKLSTHEIRFAVTETLAHLEYLRIRGKLERLGTAIWKYQPV